MVTPTDAHQSQLALLNRVLLEVVSRRQDDLPGLTEACQDDVLLTTGGTTRPAHGWFAEGVWRYGDRRVHELFLNADRRVPHLGLSAAEDVLITLLHEACHVWTQASGIQDTSRQGRYHNRRFAEIARKIGLVAEPDSGIGHTTPCLAAWARAEYADLLTELDAGLVLAREPERLERSPGANHGDQQPDDNDPGGPSPASPKTISASCLCRDDCGRAVTIRIANGFWRPGVIQCSDCEAAFAVS